MGQKSRKTKTRRQGEANLRRRDKSSWLKPQTVLRGHQKKTEEEESRKNRKVRKGVGRHPHGGVPHKKQKKNAEPKEGGLNNQKRIPLHFTGRKRSQKTKRAGKPLVGGKETLAEVRLDPKTGNANNAPGGRGKEERSEKPPPSKKRNANRRHTLPSGNRRIRGEESDNSRKKYTQEVNARGKLPKRNTRNTLIRN